MCRRRSVSIHIPSRCARQMPANHLSCHQRREHRHVTCVFVVGDTGIEPVTSSVSRKRSPTELIAPNCVPDRLLSGLPRWRRDLNPCTRLCRPLPRLSATPPRKAARPRPSGRRDSNPRPSPWQGDALPTALRPHLPRENRQAGLACVENLSRSRSRHPNVRTLM
jgi:hypothetical protein